MRIAQRWTLNPESRVANPESRAVSSAYQRFDASTKVPLLSERNLRENRLPRRVAGDCQGRSPNTWVFRLAEQARRSAGPGAE